MSPGRALLLAAATAVALAGCSSSGSGAGTSTPATSAPAPSTPATSSSPPTVTPTRPTPTATSSTPAPTSQTPRSSATSSPPTFTTTCAKLTTRVIPGGAVRGAEIAALQYVNDGPAPCRVSGFPTVTLIRKGKKVGTPSQPNGRPAKTIMLQAGEVAESLLRDFSTCNAPLADHARVTVPGRTPSDTTTVVRPVRLRACLLRVDPLGPPA